MGRALAAADTLLYEDIKATFDPELAALSSSTRAEHAGAMDTCTSWEAWERLRATSGMPARGARRVMSLVLTALNIKGVFSHVFVDEAAQVIFTLFAT